ncbi:Hypothetical predicted protein [Mytilus galloprovincialis]|uniref:5'-nucleotidase n=1 Tax=Mytilus galloprovincialis TaxID=29158 RepID=A0A8B6DY60_MYTGA|nr:Hypothetical predicted protein [Mytilus galloprovincialis]
MHTNDVHAHYNEINTFGGQCNDIENYYGGMARLKYKVDEIKRLYPNTLFLDTRDQYQGTFWFTEFGGKPPSNEDPVDVYPKVVTYNNGVDVLVVQDYDFAKYLGYLQVEFDDNRKVIRYNGNPILLDNTIPKGNLIADGMVHQNRLHADSVDGTKVFISIVNPGSIRSSIEKGTVLIE